MQVTITAEDCVGAHHTCHDCPLSRALHRQTGLRYLVGSLMFKRVGDPLQTPLPPDATAWVRDWDWNKNPPVPATFDLPIPEDTPKARCQ